MNLIFVSSFIEDGDFCSLVERKKNQGYAIQKFYSLMIKGFNYHGVGKITIISKPDNGDKILKRKKKNFDKSYNDYRYIKSSKIRFLDIFYTTIKSFFMVLFSSRDSVLLLDPLKLSVSYGAFLGAKLRGFNIVGILTDLPEYQGFNPARCKCTYRMINGLNSAVYLTDYMSSKFRVKNYIVVECLCDNKFIQHKKFDSDNKKIVLYAGGLKKKYGVIDLAAAFSKIYKKNEYLILFGDGDAFAELNVMRDSCPNIKLMGKCDNYTVMKYESAAWLLVNPRPNSDEYVKYSFPSKIIEYMLSGTPTLCFKLPGIPDEYDGYLNYFEEGKIDSLSNLLRKYLDSDPSDLRLMGEEAQQFAINKKNYIIQTKKILKLFDES